MNRLHTSRICAVAILVDQVDRPAVADDGLHEAGLVLVRAIPLEAGVLADHAQEHRQVAAGRVAVSTDVVRVEVVLPGVGPQPSHGVLAILERRRERRLAGQAGN